jgi:hypothetical protein
LLVAQIFICRYDHFKSVGFSDDEQLAILQSRPALPVARRIERIEVQVLYLAKQALLCPYRQSN